MRIIKKLSVLGLLLMVVSAISAAMLSGKSAGKAVNNGTLRQSDSPGVWTCIPEVETVNSCTATTITNTTQEGRNDSTVKGLQTQGNTSLTAGQAGDQSSILVF